MEFIGNLPESFAISSFKTYDCFFFIDFGKGAEVSEVE